MTLGTSIDLREITAPGHTAIVTQECQGAVVGPDAGLKALAEEARREAVPNFAMLVPAARNADVTVVHCLVQRRPDGRGANHNAKIFTIGPGVAIAPGTPGAELVLGPEPSDVVQVGGRDSHRLRECDHRQHVVIAGDDHDHRRADRHLEVAVQ